MSKPMLLFKRRGELNIKAESDPTIEAIRGEIYHQLFQYGAIAERTDYGISFKQSFFSAMARKPISGLSSGKITISKNTNIIMFSYELNLSNYFVGSGLIALALAFIGHKEFSAVTCFVFWAALFAVINIVSPLEFKNFLRGCVKVGDGARRE